MAEETNTQQAAQDAAAQEQQFIIERVYVKDISFEAPNSPAVFTQDWEPDTNLNLNTKVNDLGDNHFEVELHVTVSVKGKDENTAFLVEVVQAGAFMIKGYPAEQLNHLLASYCPSNLFPYAREVISNLVSKGSFPEMHLSPINFDALYAKNMAEAQANETSTEEPEKTEA